MPPGRRELQRPAAEPNHRVMRVDKIEGDVVILSNGMAFEAHDRSWQRLDRDVAAGLDNMTGLALAFVRNGYAMRFPNTVRRLPLLDTLYTKGALLEIDPGAKILTGISEQEAAAASNVVTRVDGPVIRHEYAFRPLDVYPNSRQQYPEQPHRHAPET